MDVNSKQGAEAQTPPQWGWVETEVWTERMLAALGNGVKGGKWFSLVDKVYALRTLHRAWQRVRSNKGAAGIDGVSISRFESKAEQYLQEIHQQLKDQNYQPLSVKRVYIPKAGGGERPLGIPAVKDRIVQMAMKLVMEPIFEREFHPLSFGFRPERGCKDALRIVDRGLKSGYRWIVDADVRGYFDNINHEQLLVKVGEQITDQPLMQLIRSYLEQQIMEGTKGWTPVKGTPQGAVLSPLLANIFINDLDWALNDAYHMIRYADDFIIMCKSEAEAKHALKMVREWMERHGLELHPIKTKIVHEERDEAGFDFLGYTFKQGKHYARQKSIGVLRDKIRSKTGRSQGKSIAALIAILNPMLRGWFEYFKHAHWWVFRSVDGFVRRRLRSILRKFNKVSKGTGRCWNDHRRWSNAYFAKLGLFTMHEAYLRASESR